MFLRSYQTWYFLTSTLFSVFFCVLHWNLEAKSVFFCKDVFLFLEIIVKPMPPKFWLAPQKFRSSCMPVSPLKVKSNLSLILAILRRSVWASAEASLRMLWHPGRDFVVAPFIGQNKDEDQTKKSLRCKTSWFSVRKYMMTKKKQTGLCLPISGFSVSKEKKKQMVSPQNGDTRGKPPLPLATPLGYRVCGVPLRVIVPVQHSSFRRIVAAVASRWQHCVWFDRLRFEPQTSRSRDERVTSRSTAKSRWCECRFIPFFRSFPDDIGLLSS